jgi:hypothetical protein
MAGAGATTLIFIGLIELTLRRREDEPTHPWVSPALKIAAGLGALGNREYHPPEIVRRQKVSKISKKSNRVEAYGRFCLLLHKIFKD